MSMRYFYLCVGLQARDAFFGNIKHIYPRSSNLVDQFPAKVLLEAERRYGKFLAWENVDKLLIFSSGWHTSLLNPRYHYTLQGYTKLGWMSATIEMEAANQGIVYTYKLGDWNQWMGSRFQSCQSFNGEMVDGLHKHNPSCSPSSAIVNLTVVQTLSFALSTTFVGGIMPSHDLLLVLIEHELLKNTRRLAKAARQKCCRLRVVYMACSELFNMDNGQQCIISLPTSSDLVLKSYRMDGVLGTTSSGPRTTRESGY
ncbi:hypothetical protein IW261DRAFT_1668441 [Armillaria novae-zelandiae]|uniref:Uncharacterized protein n=1 Tax=Armillaria novae-zelandiae TaxID=153914 RepID=A0AA39PK46_9AGAR|nr:hypothetical protein IW261DRAFT_1668441 [Armillaria novae-zelandiae]